MVLKGYKLWVMGQLDSTCRAPPQPRGLLGSQAVDEAREVGRAHVVPAVVRHPAAAAQVDPFESKGLKPGYHVQGSTVV
jgi:hypothetical protein